MKVPYANFKTREGDTDEVGGCTFIGGSWKDVDTSEIFDNKKVVVFALPGAFIPTCSIIYRHSSENRTYLLAK